MRSSSSKKPRLMKANSTASCRLLPRLGEGPERIVGEDPSAVGIGDAVRCHDARDGGGDGAGIDLGDDVDRAAAIVEELGKHRPIDRRMLEEAGDRLDQDQPARLGMARQALEVMAEAQAEHHQEGRAVGRIGRQLADAARLELALKRGDQIDADRADQAAVRSQRVHVEAQRLVDIGRELRRGIGWASPLYIAAVAVDDIDRRSTGCPSCRHHLELAAGALVEKRSHRGEAFGEKDARAHAARLRSWRCASAVDARAARRWHRVPATSAATVEPRRGERERGAARHSRRYIGGRRCATKLPPSPIAAQEARRRARSRSTPAKATTGTPHATASGARRGDEPRRGASATSTLSQKSSNRYRRRPDRCARQGPGAEARDEAGRRSRRARYRWRASSSFASPARRISRPQRHDVRRPAAPARDRRANCARCPPPLDPPARFQSRKRADRRRRLRHSPSGAIWLPAARVRRCRHAASRHGADPLASPRRGASRALSRDQFVQLTRASNAASGIDQIADLQAAGDGSASVEELRRPLPAGDGVRARHRSAENSHARTCERRSP